MKKSLCILSLLALSSQAFALSLDEKLTFRVLSTSSSKKTLLMNRGLEDGLALGDHAKFFLTTGVVARAVVVKVSPSRSIWSIYRLIDEAQIIPDKVLNLKIASPVKVTEDHTKSLKDEPTVEGKDKISVPQEDSELDADELKEKKTLTMNEQESAELDELTGEEKAKAPAPAIKVKKHEIEHDTGLTKFFDKDYGVGLSVGSMNFLSTTMEVDGAEESYGGSTNGIDATFDVEKFFPEKDRWYHRVSLVGLLHYTKNDQQVTENIRSLGSAFEYGLGVNVHVLGDAYAYESLVGYIALAAGVGTSSKTYEDTGVSTTMDGSTQFLSIGVGERYSLKNGLGGKLLFDYYRRVETYPEDTANSIKAMNKIVSGFRFQFGLSYRF